MRARQKSWSPHCGETAPLIEPTRLRPNHSMSLPRDEEMTGARGSGLPSQHRLALETARNASHLGTTTGYSQEALAGFRFHCPTDR